VVGNAAVLVNPENVFEIMRALHRVLLDKALRDRMKERGYQQATKFSWEKSVRRILEVYRQVCTGSGRSEPASPQRITDKKTSISSGVA
jgi:glycosyltransferase involved in cell wall biosynthesis